MDLVVLGVGSFGSALGDLFEKNGIVVHRVGKGDSWPNLIKKRYGILIAVPTQSLPTAVEERLAEVKNAKFIVSTAKGILQINEDTAVSFLKHTLGKACPPLFALSGPSFAVEIAAGHPVALSLSGKGHPSLQKQLAQKLSSRTLRIYINHDPVGVELCGALKNVYAIASGMVIGLGFGESTRSAMTTRALMEMGRIVKALGGQQHTVYGLAGVGDLYLTCGSQLSRNFRFGYSFARGTSVEEIHRQLGTVEGYWTSSVAARICKQRKIKAPLIQTIDSVLSQKIDVKAALAELMTRKLRHEFD